MGTIQDNNLPADGSEDQDEAIAAGLLAAAKKFYKEKNAILYKAVNLFVDKLIADAIHEQDTYVFSLLDAIVMDLNNIPADCYSKKLLDFVKELILNGDLDVSEFIWFGKDSSQFRNEKQFMELELCTIWGEDDVFDILEEVLEVKLFGYLPKCLAPRLFHFPKNNPSRFSWLLW